MPVSSSILYHTTNWQALIAAPCKRGSLSVRFEPDMVWHAEEFGQQRRPESFPDAVIQTCPTLKVPFHLRFAR
ncbi:DDE family transposase [Palleronia aestuarii]|uniref:DDE family transposase n=1 Tax=Palleronia aestuarii TaxID=568105 RepID=A0A2W7N5D5_9RHOB|nr:transposase [Palleronia aestuarii]PZX15291.1 DDE family transposase [Palleronia aestuarii]